MVGDFNRPTPAIRRLLPYVSHPVVPEEFARAFTRGPIRDTLHRLREQFAADPVVTQGARGGLYLEGGRVRRYVTPKVVVRDTTGAGDAFHGAFAAGIAQGLPLAENLRRAAHCTRALGGIAALLRDQSSASR